MADRYPAHAVEAKWRRRWDEDRLYETDLDGARRPFYNLMEFPYPSGEGLHVGHVYTYCGADTSGRLKRMQGRDVFQPMGFDAFGIHSENYALQLGIHPAEVVPRNVRRFREEQLQRLGCAFDWSREVNTTAPEYYRWTQWIFIQLLKAGLAYQAEAPVNWCPQDRTVLANEQVIDGRCERCDSFIERRVMEQWFLRITAYAERLLDFDGVDYPEASVRKQSHWIGRSEGSEALFRLPGRMEPLRVFTTRPDTLFGVTFLVLAPEHPLAIEIATPDCREAVIRYIEEAARRAELDRLKEAGKTGVFTGASAAHPLTGEDIPVWVADYVLARYGTGAIMAVPAHDARDHAFAVEHGLPVAPVIAPAYEGEGTLVNSGSFTGMESRAARAAITRRLEAAGAGEARVVYRLRDWLISRQRYWGPPIPVVYCDTCGTLPVPEAQLPVLLPHVEEFRPAGTGQSPLAFVREFVRTECPACGGPARRETDVSDNFLDSAWYFLRYLSPDCEDRPWDEARVRRWLPVDQYAGGPEHTTMHHLYARFLTKALHDLGHVPFDEPFRRIRLHGMIEKDGAKMSKSRGNVITPDRYLAEHGADVFRMYMLYLGPWEEGGDFTDRNLSGISRFAQRLWELVAKVESRTPSAEVEDADADADAPNAERRVPPGWPNAAERRRHRLIARVTEDLEGLRFHTAIAALMAESRQLREEAGEIGTANGCENREGEAAEPGFGIRERGANPRLGGSLALPGAPRAGAHHPGSQTVSEQWARSMETLVLLLAPLAPHLAEELWERLGRPYSVHQQPWPAWDPAMLVEETVELPVQVGGKLRDRITVPAGADEETIVRAALASEKIAAVLAGAEPRKVIVVPGRVVNVVP